MTLNEHWDTFEIPGNYNDMFVFISFIESGRSIKVSYTYIDYILQGSRNQIRKQVLANILKLKKVVVTTETSILHF